MHWLRIDRYYSSEDSFYDDDMKKDNISGLSSSLTSFGELENPSENPQVAFQPISVNIVIMHHVKQFVQLQLQVMEDKDKIIWPTIDAVSYTHVTLPTTPYV